MASAEISAFPQLQGRLLVIYDGQCGFCNRSIRWFLRRDRNDRLRFAPSDSPVVANLLARRNISALIPNTMVVVQYPGSPREGLLTRTDGVLAMLAELPSPWFYVTIPLKLIPRPVRDLGYRLVAWLRYRIAGRYPTCPIPTPEERLHFL